MKHLLDYINESEEYVFSVWDTDLDASLEICASEEAANEAKDKYMKENSGNHLEVKKVKKSEVEKKD